MDAAAPGRPAMGKARGLARALGNGGLDPLLQGRPQAGFAAGARHQASNAGQADSIISSTRSKPAAPP